MSDQKFNLEQSNNTLNFGMESGATRDTIDFQLNSSYSISPGSKPLIVNCGTITSLPKTFNVNGVTANHKPISIEFGTPSAITSAVIVTTGNGTIQLSGSIGGSTTCTIVLIEGTVVTATETT